MDFSLCLVLNFFHSAYFGLPSKLVGQYIWKVALRTESPWGGTANQLALLLFFGGGLEGGCTYSYELSIRACRFQNQEVLWEFVILLFQIV